MTCRAHIRSHGYYHTYMSFAIHVCRQRLVDKLQRAITVRVLLCEYERSHMRPAHEPRRGVLLMRGHTVRGRSEEWCVSAAAGVVRVSWAKMERRGWNMDSGLCMSASRCAPKKVDCNIGQKINCSTNNSRVVPHHSTTLANTSFTSESGTRSGAFWCVWPQLKDVLAVSQDRVD